MEIPIMVPFMERIDATILPFFLDVSNGLSSILHRSSPPFDKLTTSTRAHIA